MMKLMMIFSAIKKDLVCRCKGLFALISLPVLYLAGFCGGLIVGAYMGAKDNLWAMDFFNLQHHKRVCVAIFHLLILGNDRHMQK